MESTTFSIFMLVSYFLPTCIAFYRGHHNRGAILALNLLLGWTLIFWLVAFIWSFTNASGNAK